MFERVAGKFVRIVAGVYQRCRVLAYRTISTASITGLPRRSQPVHCVGQGSIHFGHDVSFGVFPSPLFYSGCAYLEARNSSASIRIGSRTWFNNGFCAIAEHTSIVIGDACLIGIDVEILDSDFHGLSVPDRMRSDPEWAKPVHIGDNVFIGNHVRILKGVSIGSGSVVANGSVVTRSVPENSVVGGNPARVIKALSIRE